VKQELRQPAENWDASGMVEPRENVKAYENLCPVITFGTGMKYISQKK
jgi:hypothetical protein